MAHQKNFKTSQEHEEALDRVSELMDLDFISDSVESKELDALATLIEKYEQEHYPIAFPDPIESINFRAKQNP